MFKKEIQDVKMFSKSSMYVFVSFLLVLILKIFPSREAIRTQIKERLKHKEKSGRYL